MNPSEISELVDLYAVDELPPALTAFVEAHLAANAEAAQDAKTLRETLTCLQEAPADEPSEWFTERLLDTLLRDQADAQIFTVNL